MRISISATNPCHLYPMAQELARLGALGCYYSGYPSWKLPKCAEAVIRTHSLRTNIVYGLLKLPERFRPAARSLFLWQDHGFDRSTASRLEPCDFVHAMPGQALRTFRKAKQMGIRTVLNHAMGPTRELARIMEPEYARVGLKFTDICPYDDAYLSREDEEYSLTDFHCAASTVVRDQLSSCGIDPARIWVAPYGADERIFHPSKTERRPGFRIVFAGQVCLRKGLAIFLRALEIADREDWTVEFFGGVAGESERDLAGYRGRTKLILHGTVPQRRLAEAFQEGSVLVLPSLEEGFGLVVPQALNCGLPVIVSDRVGGKDLIRHRENGSVFASGTPEALLSELAFWESSSQRPSVVWNWLDPARKLLSLSSQAISRIPKVTEGPPVARCIL